MSKLAINGGEKTVTIPQKDGWNQVTEEEIQIVTDMLRRAELSSAGGGVMADFEREFAEFMGAKYCLSQNSGTSVALAYKAKAELSSRMTRSFTNEF